MAKTKKRRVKRGGTTIDVAVRARILAKNNNALRLELEKLRRAAGQLLGLAEARDEALTDWVKHRYDPERDVDHACGQCFPDGEMVKGGFLCVPHLVGAGQ